MNVYTGVPEQDKQGTITYQILICGIAKSIEYNALARTKRLIYSNKTVTILVVDYIYDTGV